MPAASSSLRRCASSVARHPRHAAPEFVESGGPGHQFAYQDHCPARAQDFRRHRDRAKLVVAALVIDDLLEYMAEILSDHTSESDQVQNLDRPVQSRHWAAGLSAVIHSALPRPARGSERRAGHPGRCEKHAGITGRRLPRLTSYEDGMTSKSLHIENGGRRQGDDLRRHPGALKPGLRGDGRHAGESTAMTRHARSGTG